MDTHELAEEKLIVGYGPLAEFLTDNGFPLSKSTMSKYCSPAIDIGPPRAPLGALDKPWQEADVERLIASVDKAASVAPLATHAETSPSKFSKSS